MRRARARRAPTASPPCRKGGHRAARARLTDQSQSNTPSAAPTPASAPRRTAGARNMHRSARMRHPVLYASCQVPRFGGRQSHTCKCCSTTRVSATRWSSPAAPDPATQTPWADSEEDSGKAAAMDISLISSEAQPGGTVCIDVRCFTGTLSACWTYRQSTSARSLVGDRLRMHVRVPRSPPLSMPPESYRGLELLVAALPS